MKKLGTKLLFVLSVFVLSACNSIRDAAGNGDVAGDIEAATHSISVTSDEAVSVAVPTSATSGTKVDISLTYDEEIYHVSGVSVNTMTPSQTSEKSYSFVMPDEDASITVVGNYLDPAYGKYIINNVNEDKGVVLTGADKYVAAGEVVSFKVEMNPTSVYSFTGVLTITAGEDPVSFTLVNDVYSFTMPANSVSITAEVEEKDFTITIVNSETSYISYSSIKSVETVDESEVLTSVDYEYYSSTSTYTLFVKAGTVLRVQIKSTNSFASSGLKVIDALGNVTIYDDIVTVSSSNYVYFTMPGNNVTLETVKVPNYKAISVVNSEHLSITLKLKDGDNYVDVVDNDHFIPDTTVYIFVSGLEDGDYGVNTIKVTYSTSSTATLTTVDAATGIYSFKMVNYDNVTVTVTEKNLSAFKGYSFVGSNYYGNNIYVAGANTRKVSDSSYTVYVDGSGTMTKGTSKTYTITSATTKTGDGVATLSSGKDFCYSDNFVFGHYNFAYSLSNSFNKDYIVAVRSVDSSDTYSDYSFEYIVANDRTFIAVNAYRTVGADKTYIASMFFDATNKEFYGTGLSFVLKEGTTTIGSTTASFDVVVNDTTVGTVTSGKYAKA